jgi:hypothetical protein
VETGCRGGQGSPRAVVPSGRQAGLKDKVYVTQVQDCSDLINHIEVSAADIRNLPRQLVTVRS